MSTSRASQKGDSLPYENESETDIMETNLTVKPVEELEKFQNHVARFVTRNYVYETGGMTGILGQLKWESIKKGERIRVILLYKSLKGKARIPTDNLIPKTMRGRFKFGIVYS